MPKIDSSFWTSFFTKQVFEGLGVQMTRRRLRLRLWVIIYRFMEIIYTFKECKVTARDFSHCILQLALCPSLDTGVEVL